MIAVDTNVLVYAQREELPRHVDAHRRLTSLAEGLLPWALPVFCLGECLRVLTHPRLFDPPTPLADARTALEGLLESPSLHLLTPGERFPKLFFHLSEQADARGNLAFDAQIAALCLEHGVTRLLTLDRDFHRFSGLDVLTLDEPSAV